MALDPPGSTKHLSDSRTEALRALVSSLAPSGNTSTMDGLSKEEVSRLSDKLKELFGDTGPPQGTAQRNERGEVLNEEGLPIIEITEPMESAAETVQGTSSGTAHSIADAGDVDFVPMYRLLPAERERSRAQMNHILDMLEKEEHIEEERSEARNREQRREELEQRKANAKAELERIKELKEIQKKMGKALLRNMADAREKEEKEKARQEKEDLELEEARRARKPRKIVSWAELPRSEKSPTSSNGDDTLVVDGPGPSIKSTMRTNVVERFPTRSSGASSPPLPPPPAGDSDDESNPSSPVPIEYDSEGEIHSDRIASPGPKYSRSDDDSEDEDETPGDHVSEYEFDIDTLQHQREIALAYFEKRNTIGADAARSMSAHTHKLAGEDDDEWEQEEVPLEATLAGPRPKPFQSKFKSERIAQAYGTRLVSSTPQSTSLSLGSSLLPNSSGTLRRAVRTGRLEGDRLVGGDSDSENEEGDGEENARVREFMNALRRGEVTNAGAAENADALIAALEFAYGPPPTTTDTGESARRQPSPATVITSSQKGPQFKIANRAAPPRIPAHGGDSREGGSDMAGGMADDENKALPSGSSSGKPRQRVLPTNNRVIERKPVPTPPSTLTRLKAQHRAEAQ